MGKSRYWLGVIVGLLLSVFSTSNALAAPAWPMVRHDAAATAKSPYNGPDKPALLWSYTIGYYLSCPPLVAEDGTIYGIDDAAHEMHAVNPDGTRKWKVSNIGRGMALGPDGTIYAWCDWDGGSWPYLCAMNPADGSRRWTVKIGGTNGVAPVVGPDGTIYATEQQYGKIHALNPADGSVIWSSEGDGLNTYQLALAPNGAAIYGGDAFIKIRSYSTADGRLLWTSDRTCEWPAVGGDGTVYAVDNRTDGKRHLIALDPATGVTRWARELSGSGGRPAISGNVIYLTTWTDTASKLYAINDDGLTSSERWVYDIPGSVFAVENNLPIVDGQGRVYVPFDKGLIAVDPNTGEALWWHQQGGYATVVGFHFPVIGPNGYIYAGDPRYLNAIGPAETPVVSYGWPMVRYDAAAAAQSPNNGPNRPVLRWYYTIGYYLSCPPLVAQNGTIYGIDDAAHEMHAVNPGGTRKWKVSNIGRGMALAQDGTIYAWCDWDGGSWPYLCALNPGDGSRKWTVLIGGTNGVAPVVGPDGTIYATEQQYGKIHARNPSDGSVKWDSEGDGLNAYQLALAPNGAAIYAGDAFIKIRSYNTADGHLGWTSDRTCEWPAAGGDGTVYAVDNRTDGKRHLIALNPATGVTKWATELNGDGGRPAISGEVIYVTTTAAVSKLYAVNQDGSVRFTCDIPGSTFPAENSLPIVDGRGRVYVAFDKGLIAVDPNTGQVIWWHKQSGWTPEGGFHFPVIGTNNVIYAGDPRYLNAIGQPDIASIVPLLLE